MTGGRKTAGKPTSRDSGVSVVPGSVAIVVAEVGTEVLVAVIDSLE